MPAVPSERLAPGGNMTPYLHRRGGKVPRPPLPGCSAAGAIAATATRRPRGARRFINGSGKLQPDESERHRSAHHAAVQDAPISADFVIGHGAVEEAAIVPDHQIADAPAVAIDELPLRRVLQQFV